MKKLLLCLLLSFFGYQGFVFSQDYEQTQKMLVAKYSSINYDKENNCFEVDLNGKKGICDLKGKEIISPDKYTCVYTHYVEDGYYGVQIGDKMGLCDLTGKEIISPDKYTLIHTKSYVKDGYYGVQIGDKMGLCDLTGKEIISPDKYTFVNTHYVEDGYYGVKIGDKMGLCDLTGKEIISPDKYTLIHTKSYVKDGYYGVQIGDKMGLCDLTGKEIISPDKYTFVYTHYVEDGFYKVEIGDKMGACDLTGKEIIPCKYDLVVLLGSYYGVSLNGKKGACDLTGKEIIPCKYDLVVLLGSYYEVSLNGKEGACDLTGKEIVPCAYESLVYTQGEFNYRNSSGNWIPIGDTSGLAEKSVSSGSNATISSAPSPKVSEEKPLNFKDKVYVLQSSDFSKIHMVSFSKVKEFLYMIYDGQTKVVISKQFGEFTQSDSHIKIIFQDNTVTEFDIELINNNKVSLLFDGTTTPAIYAVFMSSDDLFSKNLDQFWENYNAAQQRTYQPQQPQQQYQQTSPPKQVFCNHCNGSGYTCVVKTVPTYGTQTNVKQRCPYCFQLLDHGIVHVRQRCSRCQGKGYTIVY